MSAQDATETKVLQIVEQISALSPGQRRRLLRRLRILGLWEPEEYLSDQNRLRVAPALGVDVRVTAVEGMECTPGGAPNLPVDASESPEIDERLASETQPAPTAERDAAPASSSEPEPQLEIEQPPVEMQPVETQPAEPRRKAKIDASPERVYRSSVSSKVVISGENPDPAAAPSAMEPLPGQAPDAPIGIIFDGGTRGDPALGYGSYAIRWPGLPQQIVRLRFSHDVTGDEAEYDTLIAALEAALQRLQDNGVSPDAARLDIRGDSHTVLSQVRGDIEVDDADLSVRCDRVRFLLRRFGSWSLSRYHRDHSPNVGRPPVT